MPERCSWPPAKQIGYKLTPIPLPYFSLMSVIINVFIVLVGWNPPSGWSMA